MASGGADEQRSAARERWEGAAAGWAAQNAWMQEILAPVSRWLVDAVRPQPGHDLLELAAGVGETGFLAAERIQPGGRLMSTDGAEAMVEAARARAAELGVTNAEFKPMELEWIDAPAAAFDGVLCRFGVMLALDPEAAVREMRRVLKPGGRAAFAVWDAPESNPWFAGDLLVELGHAPAPEPDAPGPFRLGDPARVTGLLEAAGFLDVELEAVDVAFVSASADELWERQSAVSAALAEALKRLTPAEHYRLRDRVDERWAPYVASDGSVAVPGRVLCAAADA